MVLRGQNEGFAPPFDAPLYGSSTDPGTPACEYELEYSGCDAVAAFFTIESDVTPILPEGVEPYSDTPQGAFAVLRYPSSSLGAYNEFFALIQVADRNGEMAYYLPYIYVTSDAGMAAGREILGAPKKQATIEVRQEGEARQGTLERPAGSELVSLTVKQDRRATGTARQLVEALFDPSTAFLGLRHLPPITGGDGLTQLVEFHADFEFGQSRSGDTEIWMGPTTVSVESSAVDPVDTIAVEDVMAGLYFEFDMGVAPTGVQAEWVH